MRNLITIFFVFLVNISIGQIKLLDLEFTVVDKLNLPRLDAVYGEKFDPGKEMKITGVQMGTDRVDYIIPEGNGIYSISFKDLDKIEFKTPATIQQAWEIKCITSGVYENLMSRGEQYDLRGEIDEESIEFINTLVKNDLIFHDDYLEDYLQTLVHKIHPGSLKDGRPGSLNVLVVKNSAPNAYCLPNGTLFITTGMLSTINTEDELLGVLIHEAAHFILDHQVININEQIERAEKRQRRAEFWAGVATTLAAASEVYLAAKHDVYLGGTLTYATAGISYSIANQVIERMGIDFNHEQEYQADDAAYSILEFLDIDPGAYASALKKCGNYLFETGNYLALRGSESHPKLTKRYDDYKNVDIDSYYSDDYQRKVSLVTTYNAYLEYNSKHFKACEELVDRNIKAGVATEDDFILKGAVTRILYDTPEMNEKALSYLQKAKTLNVVPNNSVYKQEGITLMRVNKPAEARNAFETYLSKLREQVEFYQGEGIWSDVYDFFYSEINWTKKMIYKAEKL